MNFNYLNVLLKYYFININNTVINFCAKFLVTSSSEFLFRTSLHCLLLYRSLHQHDG